MSPRSFINFFRKPAGTFLLFLMLLGAAYVIVVGFKPPTIRPADDGQRDQEQDGDKPQTVETIQRAMTAFNPPKPKETPAPEIQPTPAPREEEKPLALPPITLYAAAPRTQKDHDELSDRYAPFGRLVPCELIVTVDSSSIATPIIGLVTQPVWHDGKLIVPAGTEVHGSARVDRVRERIASTGNWTLVWQSGEELTLSGIALDREKGEGEGWAITDGSAGLRGQLVKSDDLAEIKLFAATFLSGAADALTEKQPTLFGSQIVPTLQNAPFAGAHEVLAAYAEQIQESIQRDGFYVRVPAGKQFYLYVTQTIDLAQAVAGSSRFAATNRYPDDGEADPEKAEAALRRQLLRRAIETPASLPQPSPRPAPRALARMKPFIICLIAAFLSSCASPPSVRVAARTVPGNTLPVEDVESVRYSETIKAYPTGRYIDPTNRLVMHEGHTVYRVENTGHWNLNPNPAALMPRGPLRVRDAATSAAPVNDELVMEINRQKAATRTLIQGTTAVSTKLDELSQGVAKTQQLAKETHELKLQVDATSQRIQALEQLRQSTESPSVPSTSMPDGDDLNW